MAKPKGKELKAQYDAARAFVDRALRTRDSLFTPGRPVWGEAPVQDLYHRLVESPDASSDSFDTKFQRQMAGAPPLTIQFAGELLYVHLLAGNSTRGDHKRKLINGVLAWSSSPCVIPAELDAALDKGFAAEGMAFKIHRPFLLTFLLEFTRKWWSLAEDERSRALDDPWHFKGITASIKVPKSQSQGEILLHLVHPESFESIMSRAHKARIAGAFGSLIAEPTDDVDRRLLQIRRALEKREGREISYYEPRILRVWQPEADPWGLFIKFAALFHGLPDFEEGERNYKLRFVKAAEPVIAALSNEPGESVEAFRRVLRMKEQNFVRWQDFEPFVDWYSEALPKSELAVSIVRDAAKSPAERIRGFLEHVPRDVVRSSASRTTLASLFLFVSDPENLILFRSTPFDWAYHQVDYEQAPKDADEADRYEHALAFTDRLLNEARQRGLNLRDRLDAQSIVWALAKWDTPPEGMSERDWDEFVQYRSGKPWLPDAEDDVEDKPTKSVGEVAPLESDPVGRLVLRRKNVVLYGPPGTGKTHASLTLADKWRKSWGPDSVWQVTFHPTFAYEDFIEGFRPDESGRFERRDGIFVLVCDLARTNLTRQFLLVIDELNRGDVARLFGELITLLEPDKRHEGVRRRLPYSQRDLWVPPNVHVLGTMNTADRSISLLDVAIRRRFCFVEYRPDAVVVGSSPAHHKDVGGVALGPLMDAVNRRLAAIGVDRDRAVGHSYFLIAASEPKPADVLRDRFRHDIVPLVEEYCYADRKLMRQVFERLVTEEGSLDEEVMNDTDEFIEAIRAIAGVGGEPDSGRD